MPKMKITSDEIFPVHYLEEPEKCLSSGKIVEVSEDLVKEFDEALDKWSEIQEKLKKILDDAGG